MGLLDGVLPAVYSAGNKLKRQVGGLLSDPVGTVQQQIGLLNDKAGAFNQLHSQATQEAVNAARTGAGIGPAQQKIASTLADAYNPIGMVVWHGSPHKFSKFDSSKIGTGEGAQAYGHGLYLAEKQGVAQEYADALGKEVLIKGKPAYQAKTGAQAADLPVSNAAAGHLRMNDWDLQKALKMAEEDFIETGDQWFAKVHKELSTLSPDDITVNRGQMYKVDLPDDAIAKMLDWDKPLSQQAPEVQSILSGLDLAPTPDVRQIAPKSGAHVVERLKNKLGTQDAASKALRDAGIPGIRYLDGGSRGAGGGTSNFVVFPGNEGLLSILERNGQPIK